MLYAIALTLLAAPSNGDKPFDVVIYGGTSAAVTAAVQTVAMGRSVLIVSPDSHLGGLSSGGLGWTDSGRKEVVGGLAREFYHRVWQHYRRDSAWRWEDAAQNRDKVAHVDNAEGSRPTAWVFEPHVAEQVFDTWITEKQIPVVRNAWLDRQNGVEVEGGRIKSITMLDGRTFAGRMFIDATYEGDLMAAAGVSYRVGRESSAEYGEQWNGVQTGVLHHHHHFGAVKTPIDPYWKPGDPASGLLPRISADPPGEKGAADHRVQAYCFRMCLTQVAENRVPFPRPRGYDPKQYELLLRILQAGWRETFDKFDPIPNGKTDTNNHGPFSTDNIGMNYDYPDASYERRREIIAEHETYQKGWLYFIANDPRVPQDVRSAMSRWGLAKDEFVDNGNWPHQIYVREARRMVGQHVMTENELLKRRPVPDPVGMGSYSIDSHNVQRYVTPEGYVQNEGDIGVSTQGPYQISYGSLVPQRGQCANLLVPVCASATHIAYGSIRMEPVFMVLGESAATAAVMAIEGNVPVQDVDYPELRDRLLADGQVLAWDKPADGRGAAIVSLAGTIVDDHAAEFVGDWRTSSTLGHWVGYGYRHDGKSDQGEKLARFTAALAPGRYEVRLAYTASNNRASAVAVTVEHDGGSSRSQINQRVAPPIDGLWTSLGQFAFGAKPAVVVLSNEAADGYVVADAVQFLPIDQKPSGENPAAGIKNVQKAP